MRKLEVLDDLHSVSVAVLRATEIFHDNRGDSLYGNRPITALYRIMALLALIAPLGH
jgi:hypothetical protein